MNGNPKKKPIDKNETENTPTTYEESKTDNWGITSDGPKPLGKNGTEILNELLVEIALMYTYVRHTRISISEDLISEISSLLSGTLEEMKEEEL